MCQLCEKEGHTAKQCNLYLSNSQPLQVEQNIQKPPKKKSIWGLLLTFFMNNDDDDEHVLSENTPLFSNKDSYDSDTLFTSSYQQVFNDNNLMSSLNNQQVNETHFKTKNIHRHLLTAFNSYINQNDISDVYFCLSSQCNLF